MSTTTNNNPLALGFVLLIGLACALGTTTLLILLIIFRQRSDRKRNGYAPLGLDKRHFDSTTGRPVSLPFSQARRSSRRRSRKSSSRFPALFLRLVSTNRRGAAAAATDDSDQPTLRMNGRIASSVAARSSIRSFESFFTDSSSWGGGSNGSGSGSRRDSLERRFSGSSVASSSPESDDVLSSNSSSAEEVLDARGAAARLRAIYGVEMMRPVVSSPLARPENVMTMTAARSSRSSLEG